MLRHLFGSTWLNCFFIDLRFPSQVQLALAEQQSQLPMTARATVSGIIPDPDLTQVSGVGGVLGVCVSVSWSAYYLNFCPGAWLLTCIECITEENHRRFAHRANPSLSGFKHQKCDKLTVFNVNVAFSENCEARADEAGASPFPQVPRIYPWRHHRSLFHCFHSCREDEMIWQDPVDYSHITYEYDHRCVMIKTNLVQHWVLLSVCWSKRREALKQDSSHKEPAR